jgi:hypothetical protein
MSIRQMTGIFVVGLFCLGPAAAGTSAQSAAPPAHKALGGGVKAGVNFVTIPNLTLPDQSIEGVTVSGDSSARTSFIVGGYLLASFSQALGLQTEVLYTQKGVNEKMTATVEGQTVTVDTTVKLSYVEVPVLLRYTHVSSGKSRPYLYLGPSFAFKTGARLTGTASSGSQSESLDEDLSSEVRSYDIGIALGGGVEFGRWIVDARFTRGLVNVAAVSGDDIKNASFAIMGGVRF